MAVKKSGGSDGFKGGVPMDLKADVTVSKDGSGSYKTVQEAVNAVPENSSGNRFVIRISVGKEECRVFGRWVCLQFVWRRCIFFCCFCLLIFLYIIFWVCYVV